MVTEYKWYQAQPQPLVISTVSGANITLGDSGSTSDDRLTFGAGPDLCRFSIMVQISVINSKCNW